MIREARLTDLEQILELCISYYKEGNTPKLKYDEDKTRHGMYLAIMDDDKDLSLLELDGKIVGYTYSYITDTIYSFDKVVECSLLYLHPDYRKGHNGVKLIKNLAKLAKRNKAKYVYLGITSEIQEDRTSRLYEKLKFKPIGSDYRLEV